MKVFILFCIIAGNLSLSAQVVLSPIFSDNMVLQQQSDAPVWGKATPNKDVNIVTSWDKKAYKVKADESGNWKLSLSTPVAGGPYEIKITEKQTVTLKNVMIGEVWICSGQSNMEMPLAGWGQVDNFEKEIAEAKYPDIRLLQVDKATSIVPVSDVKVMGGSWLECSPATVSEFSATAYFFARSLYQKLNIPIGLIHTSWGGTPAESWTSSESLQMMPDFKDIVRDIKEIPQDKDARNALFMKKQDDWNKMIIAKDFGYQNGAIVASATDYNDSGWKQMNLPGHWEGNGLPGFDGFVWFRKTIDIPSDWNNKELKLSLGAVDDSEVTYFNGIEVGRTDGYATPRNYIIPARLVKKGKAVITVRVIDTGGEGGFHGSPDNMYITPSKSTKSNDKIELAGSWKYKIGVDLKDVAPFPRIYSDNPHNPSSLYNAMIHPFISYKIKGAIWYQGEQNESRAYQYRTLFPLLINDWRTKWGYDFPFYFVQLAGFKAILEEPAESDWAEIREAQLGALHLENTGMAVAIDIGNPHDVHPKNKQEVGRRLALAARAKTYGENIPYSGPIYQSYKIVGNKIYISFKHTDGGLKIKGGNTLKGFSVAGPDRKFYWADAVLDGDNVIVSSPNVAFPIAVRYAWAGSPVCNFYNGADLPASPFRTDDWPGITQ